MKKNDNNEITYLIKYNNIYKIKEEFFSMIQNPLFSKPLKKDCIELIIIKKYNELIKSCLKRKKIHNNLLLNSK